MRETSETYITDLHLNEIMLGVLSSSVAYVRNIAPPERIFSALNFRQIVRDLVHIQVHYIKYEYESDPYKPSYPLMSRIPDKQYLSGRSLQL